jgi:hypothetical protein
MRHGYQNTIGDGRIDVKGHFHTVGLPLPTSVMPASRNFSTTGAFPAGFDKASAKYPDAVAIPRFGSVVIES